MEHAERPSESSNLLRKLGYDIRLFDCLFPDKRSKTPLRIQKVVQVCSTLEWDLATYRELAKNRPGRFSKELPANHRYKYEFGLTLKALEKHLTAQRQLTLEGFGNETPWVPDEIWVTSIMTFWWESTLDTLLLVKRLYPEARIRVGGLYPTLAPHHLRHALEANGHQFEIVRGRDLSVEGKDGASKVKNTDCIVTGEVPAASNEELDFEVYRQMTRELEGEERVPDYAILTTSRGCPFDCSYCAQKAYNEGSLKVRIRSAGDTFEEIRHKYHNYGVRRIAFYEDNFLLEKPNIEKLLTMLLEHKDEMPHLRLYAPEGVEVRLLHQDLAFVKLMRETGFDAVYLPLETMSRDVTRDWNRRHSHAGLFESAVKICHEANFSLHNMEVNAFVLFGMPDEKLENVVNTLFYASEMVGGLVPMLFTPVPGSLIYEQFEEYLFEHMGFDLHHLNGKLYPFLKYNHQRQGVRLADYVALESLAFRLNAKTLGRTFPLSGGNAAYEGLRRVLAKHDERACDAPLTDNEIGEILAE